MSEVEQQKSLDAQLVAKATSTSQQLRAAVAQPATSPVAVRAERENAAASTDLLVVVLESVREIRSDIKELRRRVEKVEGSEQKALGVLLKERESRIELEEEITRVDLNLKKERAKHRQELVLKIVAGLAAPAALWKLVEVLGSLLNK